MSDFTHFNDQGRAKMVNVGEKPITQRVAVAAGRVLVNEHTFSLIRSGGMKKGDVLMVAQIAGVMGAKRTPDLIPMCHIVQVEGSIWSCIWMRSDTVWRSRHRSAVMAVPGWRWRHLLR